MEINVKRMLHSEVEELVSGLENFINNEKISDVKIYVGKERKVFFAHCLILASRSEIFKNMFLGEHEMKEKQNGEWIIKEEFQYFQDFLSFLYTGKVIITPKVNKNLILQIISIHLTLFSDRMYLIY